MEKESRRRVKRLLIVTQAVDQRHPVLGFFHRWIAVFATHYEHIEVICLEKGEHALPANVRVHSLGKERRSVGRVRYALRFLSLAWKLRGKYDAVFVHMNAEYVVLGGLLWRLLGKRVGLWYVHKSVTLVLRLAVVLADVVFSASRESFRLASRKLRLLGHGIEVSLIPIPQGLDAARPRFLAAGRIAPTKDQLFILEAFALLRKELPGARLTVAGAPVTVADEAYAQEVRERAAAEELARAVEFTGPLDHARMLALYGAHDVLLHASGTGSVDKVVLEALAAGQRVVSTSEAFADGTLPVIAATHEPRAYAGAVQACLAAPWDGAAARALIQERYGLSNLVARIAQEL